MEIAGRRRPCPLRVHSAPVPANVCFSNRPFGVKHFQTIHHCSVDVAHGLALLFGIGTRALPLWDSRTRWNNLLRGLSVRLTIGPSGHANSPHPSSRREWDSNGGTRPHALGPHRDARRSVRRGLYQLSLLATHPRGRGEFVAPIQLVELTRVLRCDRLTQRRRL